MREYVNRLFSHESNSKMVFQKYLYETFPDGKRTRSAIIRRSYAQKIVDHLKGKHGDHKRFLQFMKKSGSELLDLPAIGIRNASVIHRLYIDGK